jgi:hypothetical protein
VLALVLVLVLVLALLLGRSCGASSWPSNGRSLRLCTPAATGSPRSVSSLTTGTGFRWGSGCRTAGAACTAVIYKGTRCAGTTAAARTRVIRQQFKVFKLLLFPTILFKGSGANESNGGIAIYLLLPVCKDEKHLHER